MKLAILGASGSVGRELVTQALAAGHDVTVLVRHTPRSGQFDRRVTVVQGDADDPGSVDRAVAGSDAVLSALGHAKGSPRDLLAAATSNTIAAMQAHGIRRLVVLASPSVTDQGGPAESLLPFCSPCHAFLLCGRRPSITVRSHA